MQIRLLQNSLRDTLNIPKIEKLNDSQGRILRCFDELELMNSVLHLTLIMLVQVAHR